MIVHSLEGREYPVVYGDPPLRFKVWSRKTGLGRSADRHYPCPPFEELLAFQPPAARNAGLFLWAPAIMSEHAKALITAWGFTECGHWVWVKDRIGLGFRRRYCHELLWQGTRGKFPAPPPARRWPSVIYAPRGRHSEKPQIFADMIEHMYPDLPRIELWARIQRPGWDAWGDELGSVF